MDWFRWYNGTVNDPKWRVVARRSGARLVEVLAVWGAMLENANQSPERGTLASWDDEVVGAGLDLEAETVQAIREAMQGLVLDGDLLTGWVTRNAKREDASRDRVRAYRERRRAAQEAPQADDVTQCNAGVTQCNAGVTQRNALDKIREDKRREDEIRRDEIREEDVKTTSLISTAGAIGDFCEMTGAEWRLQAGIREWAAGIEREPKYAGVDLAYEINRCAEWHQGKRKKPKAPDLAIRNWLERAASDLKKRRNGKPPRRESDVTQGAIPDDYTPPADAGRYNWHYE